MDCNKEKAFRAKEAAEKRFAIKDYEGAKKYAAEAQNLYPELEGISQMVATFDVYVASLVQIDGETDFYSVLGLDLLPDDSTVKKQFRKLARKLHPDKNRTVGAERAFQIVSEAWSVLSNSSSRTFYDLKRIRRASYDLGNWKSSTSSAVPSTEVNGCSKPSISHNQSKLETFWTVCNSCQKEYEYLYKYVNMELSCKFCKGTFVAVDTGKGPEYGGFPFWSSSFPPVKKVQENHGSAWSVRYHPGVGNEASHSNPFPGNPVGFASASTKSVHQPDNNNVERAGERVKAEKRTDEDSEMFSQLNPSCKGGFFTKKRKASEDISMNRFQEEKRTKNLTSDTAMPYDRDGSAEDINLKQIWARRWNAECFTCTA